MSNTHKRFIAFIFIFIFSFSLFSFNVLASESTTESSESTTASSESTSTSSTTSSTSATTSTTAAKKGVEVTQVFCYGSNKKLYNQLIKFSKISDQYTANVSVPLWMTSLEINIKSVSGATVTYDGNEFSANGSLYTYTLSFDATKKYSTKAYKINIKKGDKESVLTLNLAHTVFETKLESVSVDSVAAEGSNADGYKFTLPEGTTSCRIKLKTRSEESVTLGKAGAEAKKLELTSDKIFLEKVDLEDGENVFNINVLAPGTTISTTLTITVGEAVVSSDISSVPTEEVITETDQSDPGYIENEPISSETQVSSIVSNVSDNDEKETSPLIWILIGVVIAVVIGACIFMIASMGGSNKNRRSDRYDRPYSGGAYRQPAPPPARRRDLGRYVDDDYGYDDYYGEPSDSYADDGYYEEDDYYEDDGYYDDYNRQPPARGGRDQRYDRQPTRQQYQSQRRGNRNDFDDFYDDYYN